MSLRIEMSGYFPPPPPVARLPWPLNSTCDPLVVLQGEEEKCDLTVRDISGVRILPLWLPLWHDDELLANSPACDIAFH